MSTRFALATIVSSVFLACGGSDKPAKSASGDGGGAGQMNTAAGDGNNGISGAPNGTSGAPSGTSGAGQTVNGGSGCGTTPRKTDFEGRPKACVPTGQCNAMVPAKGTYKPTATPPNLPLGKLVDIGPPVGVLQDGAGDALTMTFDPTDTATLYVGFEYKDGGSPNNGLWKSTDGGATWKVLGTGSDSNYYDCNSNYLDLPIKVEVDPNDSKHMYVTEGVRGASNGFWVTWDGGESWTRAYSGDLTAMDIDPCDFCHVIVGSHDVTPVGVLETKDGGNSWTQHPPQPGWEGGSYGVGFLYDPKSKQGDANTWLVHNTAMWRTTDAGANWSKVSDISGIHGFTTLYYASDGAVYSGASGSPARSTDNGKTWAPSSMGLNTSAVQYGIIGDGTNLYSMPDNNPPPQPLMTTTEAGAQNWVPYGDGKQSAKRGMQHPHFDAASGILYFVNNVTLSAIKIR